MFLETISDADLLSGDEFYALREFPPTTARNLAEHTLEFLLKKDSEMSLHSQQHIDFIMQITGHAFSLPIREEKDIKILSWGIDLYHRWITPASMPLFICENALYFTKKMCCHLSFVFQRRTYPKGGALFDQHLKLCRRVLTLYSRTARSPPTGITPVQWNEYLTRIYLGICKEVMRGPAARESFGFQIEQDIFFCFFDVWMRSQTQNRELWDTLRRMASADWVQRGWFIEGWGHCCSALTRRLVYMLYGLDNGSSSVFISWPLFGTGSLSISAMLSGRGSLLAPTNLADSDPDDLSAETPYDAAKFGRQDSSSSSRGKPKNMVTRIFVDEPRLLIFLWKRMLTVLDLSAITDPECFGIALAWISRMVDMFLKVTESLPKRRSGILPPDGNSILRVFSEHLFRAAHISRFDNGQAVALGALCRVFCGKAYTAWQPSFMLNYIHALQSLLSQPKRIEIGSCHEQMIEHGSSLFACDYPGSRALIPLMIPWLAAVLNRPSNSRLRLAAISMLCSLCCLETHFWGVKSATMPVRQSEKMMSKPSLSGSSGAKSVDSPRRTAADASGSPSSSSSSRILPETMKKSLVQLSKIFEDSFETENCEYNVQKLLWVVSVYIHSMAAASSDASLSTGGCSRLVNTIWKYISDETAGKWQFLQIECAFKVFMSILPLNSTFAEKRQALFGARLLCDLCTYARDHFGAEGAFPIDERRLLSIACLKVIHRWVLLYPEVLQKKQVNKQIQQTVAAAIKVKAERSLSSDDTGTPGALLSPSFAASPSPMVSFWNMAMEEAPPAMKSSLIIKRIHLEAVRLARLVTVEIGTLIGQHDSPLQCMAQSALDERQIEESLHKMCVVLGKDLKSYSWNSRDRVRFFSFKKSRLLTVIEMPRFSDEDLELLKKHDLTEFIPFGSSAVGSVSISEDAPPPYTAPDEELPSEPVLMSMDSMMSDGAADIPDTSGMATKCSDFVGHSSPEIIERICKTYPFPKPLGGAPISGDALLPSSDVEGAGSTGATDSDGSPGPTTTTTSSKIGGGRATTIVRTAGVPFRSCDVIILLRDTFGKYCWQISGVEDDLQKIAPAQGECEPRPGDEYTFSPLISAKDKFGQGLSDAQAFGSEIGFTPKVMDSTHPLATAVPNICDCTEPYWSSAFIAKNWASVLASQPSVKKLAKSFTEQTKTESTIVSFYQKTQMKGALSKTDAISSMSKLVPMRPLFDEYNELLNRCHRWRLPDKDAAATFVHARRLLSTLGLLRWNSATLANRDLEILEPRLDFVEDLFDLDKMKLLNPIGCAILIHDANDMSVANSKSGLPLDRPSSLQTGRLILNDSDMLQSGLESHSKAFDSFVSRLAPDVSLARHVGFRSGLKLSDCSEMPYWADHQNELAVVVPSRLTSGVSQTRKKQLYLSNAIRIIWSTSRAPVFLSRKFVTSNLYHSPDTPVIYIRINAMQMGLYRISIHGDMVLPHLQGFGKRAATAMSGGGRVSTTSAPPASPTGGDSTFPEPPSFETEGFLLSELHSRIEGASFPSTGFNQLLIGPLVDGMVISDELLPELVRQTVINAHNLVSSLMSDQRDDSMIRREKLVHRLCNDFVKYGERDKQLQYLQHFFSDPSLAHRKHRQSKSFGGTTSTRSLS